MNSKTKTILWAGALVVVLVGAGVLYKGLSRAVQPQGGLPVPASSTAPEKPSTEQSSGQSSVQSTTEPPAAPEFSVEDAQSNTVAFTDFVGKPIVINFWASWCPPCKAEMPEFETVWQELGDDVTFLMINATDGARETKEKAAAFLAEAGFSFPVYYDVNQEAAYLYGISSLPTTVFIDAEGRIVTGYIGMLDEQTLRGGIALIHPDAPTE